MKYVALIALLFLVSACTVPVETCSEGEIPREFGGCCADADRDGTCDPQVEEPVEEELVLEPPIEVEIETPVVEEEPVIEPDPRSIAEIYLDTFWNSTHSFSYYFSTEEFGRVWVWIEKDTIQYMPVETLFLVEDGVVKGSDYNYYIKSRPILESIDERVLPVISYLLYVEETGKYDGCFVDSAFFSMENCILDYPNRNPVVHYNVQFSPPKSPIQWVEEYIGREPSRILEKRTYRLPETGNLVTVDEVYFPLADGELKFYIHHKFKIPLEIEQLDEDGKVKDETIFYMPTFNTHEQPGSTLRLESRYWD